jgi:hypothetical protein
MSRLTVVRFAGCGIVVAVSRALAETSGFVRDESEDKRGAARGAATGGAAPCLASALASAMDELVADGADDTAPAIATSGGLVDDVWSGAWLSCGAL